MENGKRTASPFEKHGKLSVRGAALVDKNGKKYRLYGMSTHGLAWFPQYVNHEAFRTLRDDWNTNCVRLALYTCETSGYCTDGNKEQLKELVKSAVSYADELGMYVIIDWHVLDEKDPNVYKDEAKIFFDEMSRLYKDHGNIIYEICNEPNTSAEWDDIRSYANEIIPIIRNNAPDAVIIVGTPTWSQDVDCALKTPLEFDNIMYSLHFYADTHTEQLRNKADVCISSGLPVFISEFNISDSFGKGNVNTAEGDKWFELINKHNLSYICWSLSNSLDQCSVFTLNNEKLSGWNETDLSKSGKWVYNKFISEMNR